MSPNVLSRRGYCLAAGLMAGSLLLAGCEADNGGAARTRDTRATVRAADVELTDSRILGALRALNEAEVQNAQLVIDRGSNAEVRRFAQRMRDEHQRSNRDLDRLATNLRLSVEDSAHSDKLRRDNENRVDRLRAASGAEVDRRYINQQVNMHRQALDMVQNRWQPAALNSELRDTLNQLQRDLREHLDEAQRLQGIVGRPR